MRISPLQPLLLFFFMRHLRDDNFAWIEPLEGSFARYILDAQGARTLAPNEQTIDRVAGSNGGLKILREAQKGTIE